MANLFPVCETTRAASTCGSAPSSSTPSSGFVLRPEERLPSRVKDSSNLDRNSGKCFDSIIHHPLSIIHYPLSTIHYPLSIIHYPFITILYHLSNIHYYYKNGFNAISVLQNCGLVKTLKLRFRRPQTE